MIEMPVDEKAMLVEQIMALIGRSSPDPVRYRRVLYLMDVKTLRHSLQNIMEEHGVTDIASLPSLPSVELPFPALENGTPEHETGKPEPFRRDPASQSGNASSPNVATPSTRGVIVS